VVGSGDRAVPPSAVKGVFAVGLITECSWQRDCWVLRFKRREHTVRIHVIHQFAIPSIDGIQLEHFESGHSYDVGAVVGNMLLAEGWAVPDDDAPTQPPTKPQDLPAAFIAIARD